MRIDPLLSSSMPRKSPKEKKKLANQTTKQKKKKVVAQPELDDEVKEEVNEIAIIPKQVKEKPGTGKASKKKKKKKVIVNLEEQSQEKSSQEQSSELSTERIGEKVTEIATIQISDEECSEIATVEVSDDDCKETTQLGSIKVNMVEELKAEGDDCLAQIPAESESDDDELVETEQDQSLPTYNSENVEADAIPLIGEETRKRPAALDFMETADETKSKVAKTEDEQAKPALKEEAMEKTEETRDTVQETQDTVQETQEETDLVGGGAPFLGYENFDSYSNVLLPQVVQFLKVTKKLPSTKDEYDFFLSYPSFMAFSKNQGQRVLQLIGKMFKHHHVYQAWNALPSTTVTGVEEQTDAVVEANDTLLERVDKIIDMLKLDKKEDKLEIQQKTPKDVLVAAWNTNSSSQQNKPIRLLHSKNILRPQLRWTVKPDNTETPFIPLIRYKPNAKVPLQEIYKSLLEEGKECGVSAFIRNVRGDQTTEYPHPYEHELETLEIRPWQLQLGLKQEPKEVADTPLTIVDKVEQVAGLVDKLAAVREVAIDLEAHSYRSYLGFACLMQISTRTEDFIVDTLSLRTELQPLNKVFTNPDIVKVLHGAKQDIIWLQRDLGLYIVNMFDTFHASKQLSMPRCSLSYLLGRYCDVTADKQYQLADWRIRPLPDVMVKYAREDTHFLLYIYDCLRYELLHQGSHTLESVYRNSKSECQQVFRKPVFTEDSYSVVYAKTKIPLQPQQKECLKLIFKWRDQTARSEDESPAFVLPNHMMFKIAELLPGDQEGVLACCNPPPPLVRLHVQELFLLVERARHYNPLLDPANTSVNEAEYTPGFLDTTHQHSVESMLTPKSTPARRIKERKEIFYVPKSGPDVQIKSQADADSISITSETGTISESTSSRHFFDISSVKCEIADAVRAVKESMAAPFQQFMSKIEQLREEERAQEEAAATVVYPIKEEIVPEDKKEGEEDSSVIIFNTKNKRPFGDQTNDLRATTKRRKKTVGDVTAFDYEEITMSKLAESEEVKPPKVGEMLNKGEDSRATSIRKRTNMKSGNKSSFQNFLKTKFKR